MRIVLNSRVDDASSEAAIHGLAARLRARGIDAAVNEWGSYERYDVAVFLPYDDEADAARAANPRLRVVLADPKLTRPEWQQAAREADLLLVSSVEQRDAFLPLNRNVVVVHMFPPLAAEPRVHRDDDSFVVGYHGNRIHLEAMAASVTPALEELGRRRPVELLAIYDVRGLGRAELGLPQGVTVTHVQWTRSYAGELARADAGIVPNELPLRDRQAILEASALPEPELRYEPFDHLVRFKVSANAGRVYPFALLGIPVVADFAPSAAQVVEDGESGFVVSSPHGWFEALETLAGSAELRRRMGATLRERVLDLADRDVDRFLAACAAPSKGPPPPLPGHVDAEAALARLPRYARPGRSLARFARRLS